RAEQGAGGVVEQPGSGGEQQQRQERTEQPRREPGGELGAGEGAAEDEEGRVQAAVPGLPLQQEAEEQGGGEQAGQERAPERRAGRPAPQEERGDGRDEGEVKRVAGGVLVKGAGGEREALAAIGGAGV